MTWREAVRQDHEFLRVLRRALEGSDPVAVIALYNTLTDDVFLSKLELEKRFLNHPLQLVEELQGEEVRDYFLDSEFGYRSYTVEEAADEARRRLLSGFSVQSLRSSPEVQMLCQEYLGSKEVR